MLAEARLQNCPCVCKSKPESFRVFLLPLWLCQKITVGEESYTVSSGVKIRTPYVRGGCQDVLDC
ncbi:hypothetical protein C2E23DRAFT_849385 [Lenzites betulinus]|nr:hypothetical protein C2E23DRAFT_849385 [Lenzites betulinus]